MYDLIRGVEGQKHWITYIKNRTQEKPKNFLGFFSGETGSGKSYSSLSVGEETDPRGDFSVERCYFSVQQFRDDLKEKKIKNGGACVIEEVGVEANSRQWQSMNNKILFFLAQTQRKKRHIVLFNAPSYTFFDSGTRKLLHAVFDTVHIDEGKKECIVKPLLLQYNSRYDKIYWKRLRVWKKGVGVSPVSLWGIPLPSKQLRIEYGKVKDEYMDRITTLSVKNSKQSKLIHPQTCTKCGYQWNARTAKPAQCPGCKKSMNHPTIPPISLGNKVIHDNIIGGQIPMPV